MTTHVARRDPGDVLALGFGTTVAMWGVGYLLRMPGTAVPAPAVLAVVLCLAILGGFAAGRWTARGLRGGLYVGLLAGLLNLLVIGGLVSHRDTPNQITPSALWYVPGSIAVTAALTTLGAAFGVRRRPIDAGGSTCWRARFAAVAVAATLVLISAGGLVTSHDAGLAVPDWPNSFGYGMFLYPLARMTGGIYYEHTHRLFGSLVGLTTVVLALYLAYCERRGWVKWLAGIAVVAVILQGVLGGLRVTGKLTLDTAPEVMAPNIVLAMVHAVLAQVFLCMLITLRIVLGETWRTAPPPAELPAAQIDRPLLTGLLVAMLLQTALGAALRHVDWGLHLHITLAVIVVLLAVIAGFRATALYRERRPLPQLAPLLIWLAGAQLLLGIAALVVTRFAPAGSVSKGAEVALATAHQTLGALLLASALAVWLWHRRLAAVSGARSRGFPVSPVHVEKCPAPAATAAGADDSH